MSAADFDPISDALRRAVREDRVPPNSLLVQAALRIDELSEQVDALSSSCRETERVLARLRHNIDLVAQFIR
jgi:hypothetical protein